MQKICSGVHDLIFTESRKSSSPISIYVGDTVTSKPETVANSFNDFFTSIADTIKSEIPPSYSHFSRFLRSHNFNSVLLSHTTPEEVAKVIGSLSASKSTGPSSIPIKVLKLLKRDISGPIPF